MLAMALGLGCSPEDPAPLERIGLGEDELCTPLSGQWGFYPFELIAPSDSLLDPPFKIPFDRLWNDIPEMERSGVRSGFGFASYSTQISVPEGMKNPALWIPEMYCAYRLFANGRPIASNGLVGQSEREHKSHWLPLIVPLPQGSSEIVLTLHLSNFDHFRGGAYKPIVLGPLAEVQLSRTREFAWVSLLSGGLLIGGLFFLGFFLFDRSDRTVLYFSLFCISYAYRMIGTEGYVLHEIAPSLRFPLAIRLEYGSLYLSALMFAAFLRNLYPVDIHTWVIRYFLLFTAFQLLCLALPVYYFSGLLLSFLAIGGMFIAYAFYIFLRAFYLRRTGAGWALFSGFFLAVSSLILILDYLGWLAPGRGLYYALYAGFFISQSLILSYRFAQNQMRLLIKAESNARSRSDFISTLGHELRTPLNTVFGVSSMLEKSLKDPKEREQLSSIRLSAEQLTQTISEMLSFSDVEAGEPTLNNESFRLQELIQRQHSVVRPFLDRNAVKFRSSISEELGAEYTGDPMRIRQLLYLLSSFCLRMLQQGELQLRVSRVSVSGLKERVRFEFEHPDLNLSLEVQEMAESGDVSSLDPRRLRYDRQMMSLASAVQLIRGMGGRMKLGSRETPSLGFELELRRVNGAPELAEERSINPRLRILVVDDNPMNTKLMELMFGGIGLGIDTASGGREALNLASRKAYHLVFMDLQMPEMDGLETTRRLLTEIPDRPIVIALTANTAESDRRMALEAGMSDFMSKPVKLAELKALILKWQSLSEFIEPQKEP